MKRIVIEILREIYMWYVASLNFVFTYLPWNFLRVWVVRYLYFAKVGKGVTLGLGVQYKKPRGIAIGNNTNINPRVILDGRAGLTIGNNVDIGEDVAFYCGGHDVNDPYYRTYVGHIRVQDYACIFARAMVVRGVTIGEGAVVGAMAVLNKDVEPYTIVAGIPAKPIGERSRDLRYDLSPASLRRTWQHDTADQDEQND